MDIKYSIRDFFVYFLTGFYFILIFLIEHGYNLYTNEKYLLIFEHINFTILILIVPLIYLLGHFIHSVDWMIWEYMNIIGRKISIFGHSRIVKRIVNIILFIINNNRVAGILNKKNIDEKVFKEKLSLLRIKSIEDKAEYWHIMNDLFESITLISFGWLIYSLFNFNEFKIIIYLILSIIFWHRARQMALNYVSNILAISDELKL